MRVMVALMRLTDESESCVQQSMVEMAKPSLSARELTPLIILSRPLAALMPFASATEMSLVAESAIVSRNTEFTCSCTEVCALPVILGAMAFFFSFS